MLGLNLRGTYHQWQYIADDPVGGATGTYSALFTDVHIRISARRPSQQSLEAGLEVVRVFDMIFKGQLSTYHEKDQIEITFPSDNVYYGDRFRITGIQPDSRRSSIGHTELTLERIERSRIRQ